MKIKKYAIKHPKYGLLGFYTTSNSDGEFCVDVEYNLSSHEENIWMVDKYETALDVVTREGDWFNADYNSPLNGFVDDDLEVVELCITIS